jgi:molybdopterin molybdotransferase
MPRLIPLAETRAAYLAKIEPIASTSMATAKAGGLVLAEDMTSPADFPERAIALQRGYAIAARASVGASSYLPAPLAHAPVLVEPGEALPAGTEAVVEVEDIHATQGTAEILAQVAPGRHVRRAGGDIPAGRVIVAAGLRLIGSRIAVLRAAGLTEVPVRVPGVVLMAPQGTSASVALLMDLAAQAGADVHIAYVPQSRLAGALRSAASADLVLVAGWNGAAFRSALEAAQAVNEAGMPMAQNLAVAPGSATACGFIAGEARPAVPVVIIPGQLEETLAAWLMLARPCLDRLAGFSGARPSSALPLARKIVSAPGLVDLGFVKREGDMWKPVAAGDISWAAIAGADAWLEIPAESEGYPASEIVEAEFL